MKKYIFWGMITIFLLSACYYESKKDDSIYIIKYYINNEVQQWITNENDIMQYRNYCTFIDSETNLKIHISGNFIITEQKVKK